MFSRMFMSVFVLTLALKFCVESVFAAPPVGKVATVGQIAAVNLTAAGTDQTLSASKLVATCFMINALAANTGVIYVGAEGVAAATGFPLAAGDTLVLCADPGYELNLANIWIDGGTTNDDVKVTYTRGARPQLIPKPLAP